MTSCQYGRRAWLFLLKVVEIINKNYLYFLSIYNLAFLGKMILLLGRTSFQNIKLLMQYVFDINPLMLVLKRHHSDIRKKKSKI